MIINSSDFYVIVIDIKSIKDINIGWNIKMSKRAEENYKSFLKDKVLKIGVIGNSNKGKSFLLSKISNLKLPSSTDINTEGLSIKYPELEGFENRKIVLLDSAGLETPVLEIDDDKKQNINENEDNNEINEEKENEENNVNNESQNIMIMK